MKRPAAFLNRKERPSRNRIKDERLFYLCVDFILIFATVVVAYPILYIFSASFSSASAVLSGRVVLWPVDFSLEGYKAVFQESRVWNGYLNTIIYTFFGTLINLILSIFCAYPLSRKDFAGRKVFMFLVTLTLIFKAGMLPTYLVIKELGMLNTRWAMLLPTAISAYNVIIMRTFYQTNISDELLEAAFLDGCDNFRFLWQIVLPLSKAITMVMLLFYSVSHWNAYFNALIYLHDRELFPLQIVLREILVLSEISSEIIVDPELAARQQGLAELLKYSLIIVASLPIWCVYPFVQKYFEKGIMIGSLKG